MKPHSVPHCDRLSARFADVGRHGRHLCRRIDWLDRGTDRTRRLCCLDAHHRSGGAGVLLGGSLASIAAQIVNWGGLALAEPRTFVNFAGHRSRHHRHGAVALASEPAGTGWHLSRMGAVHVLGYALGHADSAPDNPIGSSNSDAIRLTFYGLFAITLLAAMALVAVLRRKHNT